MRILLVGAGGVGTAFARIAARRPFAELVIADYDLGRAQRAAAARDGYEAVQLDARERAGGRSRYFTHCVYSDVSVQQFRSSEAICFQQNGGGLASSLQCSAERGATCAILSLNKRRGETAFFAVASSTTLDGSGVMLVSAVFLQIIFTATY